MEAGTTATLRGTTISIALGKARIFQLNNDATEWISISFVDAGAQPLDSDLTAIAALTPSSNNFIVGSGAAWIQRTSTQTIAILQAGAWTFAQLATFTLGVVVNSTTGLSFGSGGTAASPILRFVDAGLGFYRSTTNQLTLAGGSSQQLMRWTSSTATAVSAQVVSIVQHIFSQGVAFTPIVFDTSADNGAVYLLADISSSATSCTIDSTDATMLASGRTFPLFGTLDNGLGATETVLVSAINTATGVVSMPTRAVTPGAVATACAVADLATFKINFDGEVLLPPVRVACMIQNSNVPTRVFLPPISSNIGGATVLPAPNNGQIFKVTHGGGTGPAEGNDITVWGLTGIGGALQHDTIDLHRGGSELMYLSAALSYAVLNHMRKTLATETAFFKTSGGSPEGVITAEPGAMCFDTTNEVFYRKNTGSGDTGWILNT